MITYKALAIDLDGSLVYEHDKINPDSLLSVKRFIKAGYKFFIISGRPFWNSLPTLEKIGLIDEDIEVVGYNGGEILRLKSGEKIIGEKIPIAIILPVLELARKEKLNSFCFHSGLVFSEPIIPFVTQEQAIAHIPLQYVTKNNEDNLAPLTKVIISSDNERLLAFQEKYAAQFKDDLVFCISQKYYLEVMPKSVSKASALQTLCSFHNISCQECIAVGDADNDLEMISAAGLGVALKNSTPALLKACDEVIGDVTEDALAQLIKNYFSI